MVRISGYSQTAIQRRRLDIPRIVKALREAEAKDGKRLGLDTDAAETKVNSSENTLDFHLRAIDALGWKITGISPK